MGKKSFFSLPEGQGLIRFRATAGPVVNVDITEKQGPSETSMSSPPTGKYSITKALNGFYASFLLLCIAPAIKKYMVEQKRPGGLLADDRFCSGDSQRLNLR